LIFPFLASSDFRRRSRISDRNGYICTIYGTHRHRHRHRHRHLLIIYSIDIEREKNFSTLAEMQEHTAEQAASQTKKPANQSSENKEEDDK
jgi:hypothetical protein